MIRYTMLTLIMLVVSLLLNGCIPDLETQLRKQEAARVKTEIARTKLEVARAKTKAKVSKTKLLSEKTDDRINFRIKLEDIRQEAALTAAQIEADLQKLAKESGVKLTNKDVDIRKANYKAADSLLQKLKKEQVKLSKDAPILVASFVNLDNLSDSSTFGRVVSEQFASRFNQKGYATIELKLRTNVFIKEGSGEFLLSRELAEIGIKHRAQAVVVGTYAVASKKVYLTSRVINVGDGRVLSSHDYNVPISRDMFKMLLKGKDKGKPSWL